MCRKYSWNGKGNVVITQNMRSWLGAGNRLVVAATLCSALAAPAWGQPKVDAPTPNGEEAQKPKLHTITASVEHGVTRLGSPLGPLDPREPYRGPGLPVEAQVGEFTIPEGQIAQGLKFHFADPKTGFESDKIRKGNIYSVTRRKFVGDQETLPPGVYRFVVGGLPGSMGNLTFTTVPQPTDVPVDEPPPKNRTNKTPTATQPPPKLPPVNAEGKKLCPYCGQYH